MLDGCPFWMTIHDRPIKCHNSELQSLVRVTILDRFPTGLSIVTRLLTFAGTAFAAKIFSLILIIRNLNGWHKATAFGPYENPRHEPDTQNCRIILWQINFWTALWINFTSLACKHSFVDILLGECSLASLTVLFCFSLFALDLSSSFWLLALSFYLQVKGSLTLTRLVSSVLRPHLQSEFADAPFTLSHCVCGMCVCGAVCASRQQLWGHPVYPLWW